MGSRIAGASFQNHGRQLGEELSVVNSALEFEINPNSCATLSSDTSRPLDKPSSGRSAVKVINHLARMFHEFAR